jgi:outer membrane protein TolC
MWACLVRRAVSRKDLFGSPRPCTCRSSTATKAARRAVAADAVVRQREAELADVATGLRFEVSAALLDVNAAAAAVEVARSGETLAREELTQAEDRVRAGVASSIELTQAQEAVSHGPSSTFASVYNHTIAKALLARALGEVDTQFLALVGGRP